MGLLTPEFAGQVTVDRLPDDFVSRIRKRVEDGLLSPGRRTRADYRVHSVGRDEIRFGAAGLPTAYNVGLNEVTVVRSRPDRVRYRVSYRRWARTAVLHGALLGLVFLIGFSAMPALRRDVDSYPHGRLLFWAIVGFFSLAWPWLLVAMHRPAAERALQRILRETLS